MGEKGNNMAILDPNPAPGDFGYKKGEPIKDGLAREDRELEKYYSISDNLADGTILGAVLRWQVADGYAFYVVTKEEPLTVQHIPFGSGYQVDPILLKGLDKGDVHNMLHRRRTLLKLFPKR